MLSQLDSIIYPDRCEVLELVPSQRYVYIIFKNGHSSLIASMEAKGLKMLFNEQIKRIESIDVVLRDPDTRMLSGINTYIQKTLSENPGLDKKTVTWFAKNYLFLNRHYSTQFSWLLNLARYIKPETHLNFLSMADLSTMTDMNLKPIGVEEPTQDLIDELQYIPNFEMFRRVDLALMSCVGKSLTFTQTVEQIKKQDQDAYRRVIEKPLVPELRLYEDLDF
jgi:hypothetical protein